MSAYLQLTIVIGLGSLIRKIKYMGMCLKFEEHKTAHQFEYP